MRLRTKLLIKIWFERLLMLIIVGLIIWANVIRLQDNEYSNYEKAIDFGRMKDEDELVKPVIAAIFYAGKNTSNNITSYFNHADNYKKRNVKLVVVPKKVTTYSAEVVEKLYEAIKNNNDIQKVLLVYDQENAGDVKPHKKMLRQVMQVKNVAESPVSMQNLQGEKRIDKYLGATDSLVVFLADLDKGLNEEDSDFLTGEAVYFAQKYYYQMNVFDVIDTQLAKALEKDYETLYPLQTMKDEPLLQKQKRNLERYRRHYWHVLRNYFELNLLQLSEGSANIMPPRTEENYRLYDRGRLVLKAYDENYIEIFEIAEMEENKGIALLLTDAVKRLIASGKALQAKFFKLYLLTDMEAVTQETGTMLMSHLDQDDGVYAEYRGKSGVLVADDRPDDPENLAGAVRAKAGISPDVAEEDISFYRFKTVEMTYGD